MKKAKADLLHAESFLKQLKVISNTMNKPFNPNFNVIVHHSIPDYDRLQIIRTGQNLYVHPDMYYSFCFIGSSIFENDKSVISALGHAMNETLRFIEIESHKMNEKLDKLISDKLEDDVIGMPSRLHFPDEPGIILKKP